MRPYNHCDSLTPALAIAPFLAMKSHGIMRHLGALSWILYRCSGGDDLPMSSTQVRRALHSSSRNPGDDLL
jgi:hypothetical protein